MEFKPTVYSYISWFSKPAPYYNLTNPLQEIRSNSTCTFRVTAFAGTELNDEIVERAEPQIAPDQAFAHCPIFAYSQCQVFLTADSQKSLV